MSDYAEDIQDLRRAILLLEEKIDALSEYCIGTAGTTQNMNAANIQAFTIISDRLDDLEGARNES